MNKLYKTPIITSIVMLFLALFDLPTGYFTLIRIIVCGTAIYFVFIAKGIKKLSWVWTMGFITILFNPFIPIHLERGMWGLIDIIVAFIFFAGIFALSGEGATKSIFKTKAFRIFRKIALVISLCILVVIVLILTISAARGRLRKKLIQDWQFDMKTARPIDGAFIETYSKGEIIIVGNSRDGKPDGLWKIYDKHGNLRAEKQYDKGILSNVVTFDENAELIRKYSCDEGKIVGGIRLSDMTYVSDCDVATREAVSFVNMDYEDENIKARLLHPYYLIMDNKKYLVFEIDAEVVNRTKIIANKYSYSFSRLDLRDNFGNGYNAWRSLSNLLLMSPLFSDVQKSKPFKYIESKITFIKKELRFGDTGKVIFFTEDKPLENSIYFKLTVSKDALGNINDINFIFPAFFIEDRNSFDIENQ